jgi:hypothetical protein
MENLPLRPYHQHMPREWLSNEGEGEWVRPVPLFVCVRPKKQIFHFSFIIFHLAIAAAKGSQLPIDQTC